MGWTVKRNGRLSNTCHFASVYVNRMLEIARKSKKLSDAGMLLSESLPPRIWELQLGLNFLFKMWLCSSGRNKRLWFFWLWELKKRIFLLVLWSEVL